MGHYKTTIPAEKADCDKNAASYPPSHLKIEQIEEAIVTARPRLLRLATLRGVAIDAIDDVVQETLLEAWQYLDRLRAPEQFDLWLDGICRNVCRRWQQKQQRQLSHVHEIKTDEWCLSDLADHSLLDPREDLMRQDLETLLDRSLAHLSPENRRAIELCYLFELPQREAALRLGMTVSALEARLHRARRQLQLILGNEMHDDAANFGLILDNNALSSWREIREWCDVCGRHRLRGMFKPLPDGKVELRICCPECSPLRQNAALLGYLPIGKWHSFRPAMKRINHIWYECMVRSYCEGRSGKCLRCGAENPVSLMSMAEYCAHFFACMPSDDAPSCLHLVSHCYVCSSMSIGIAGVHALDHPAMKRFKVQHPRSILEWPGLTTYAGLPAIHLRLQDCASTAHISAFVHRETQNILAIVGD